MRELNTLPMKEETNIFSAKDFVFIKSEYKIVKINFDDILFCKGMKDYIQIYLNGKSQPVVTLKSLNAFETKLPPHKFVRVHRSYIVSLRHIDSISKNEISIGKQIVPIGSMFKADFFTIVDLNS
ncbi:MAG: LytTR family DNA-binding domain-containing protein [Bacteroidota bacterium]|jgi:DNA-binding LytR/AlgR family response regulator|nr:LytTR family DNA-binding domain-containing protein [Bacteroidota bacterium]